MVPSFLLLLPLLGALPGVLSQVQLVESGPGVVKPSEPLRLSCIITGDSVSSTSAVWHWIRQPPRKELEWMGRVYYRNSKWYTNYTPSLQNRISISADSSKNEYFLQLTSVTTADTSMYYCARDTVWYNSIYTSPELLSKLMDLSGSRNEGSEAFDISVCQPLVPHGQKPRKLLARAHWINFLLHRDTALELVMARAGVVAGWLLRIRPYNWGVCQIFVKQVVVSESVMFEIASFSGDQLQPSESLKKFPHQQ
ncbi:immunoglobulin gamma-1 heavy chain-like [Tachyglossus aculeatus]|uniref:immunoglobulin gamma-1 heavy chain-like n=1 Tax=Tachyglossus aculeatus TaxID=9261 RepID=UPI0018F5AD34|nr:immunoglobulin gamma-1 heavy chain-like [Tachyglossus aculeatus]